MTREEIIKVVTDSGLRGRGGAGFPAGRKWETAFKQDVDTKYIISVSYTHLTLPTSDLV